MDPQQYQTDALRTEHTPDFVRLLDAAGNPRAPEHNKMVARLLHSVLGLMTETGEFADALKRHIVYGTELDKLNLVEEHGDRSWYDNLFLAAVQSSWEESWTKNIAKLKARFGDKFAASAALNRDLDAERRALETPMAQLAAMAVPLAKIVEDGAARFDAHPIERASIATRAELAHRQMPPDTRQAYIPYKPCESCDDPLCLTVRDLQTRLAAVEVKLPKCSGFRSAADYRDHLPCARCEGT